MTSLGRATFVHCNGSFTLPDTDTHTNKNAFQDAYRPLVDRIP